MTVRSIVVRGTIPPASIANALRAVVTEMDPNVPLHDVQLTFMTTYDQVGNSARDAAGWHPCFDQLEAHLAGEPLTAPAGSRSRPAAFDQKRRQGD